MERILDNNLHIDRFTCAITSRPDVQKYVDEYLAGTRTLSLWKITFPKRGERILSQTHRLLNKNILNVKCYGHKKHYELRITAGL